MIHDDSKHIRSHAKNLNKKEGHNKARTIAMERKIDAGPKPHGYDPKHGHYYEEKGADGLTRKVIIGKKRF